MTIIHGLDGVLYNRGENGQVDWNNPVYVPHGVDNPAVITEQDIDDTTALWWELKDYEDQWEAEQEFWRELADCCGGRLADCAGHFRRYPPNDTREDW
jgi:hypothetical protein